MNIIQDTICAIATPHGIAAQGIIKLSGKEAINIVAQIFFPVKKGLSLFEVPPYSSAYGWIKNKDTGETIDDAMVLVMKAPKSYTGEDQVEITCHGSPLILSLVMKLLIQKGARLAEPGEFTRRAFANAKMDLSQAESVADIIASTNRDALRLAMSQMKGLFRKRIEELRSQLIQFASLIELELDFSEEDIEFVSREELLKRCTSIIEVVEELAKSYDTGQIIKNGIPIAIVGSTNAGKSTLLNGLLQEEKAIVSDIHGTTRDIIEDTLLIQGQQFRVIDTAGIRQTDDQIENIGIQRALKQASTAELILWIIDPTEEEQLSHIYHSLAPYQQKIISIINKKDIATAEQVNVITTSLAEILPQKPIIISAKTNRGIQDVRELLHEHFKHVTVANDQIMVTNLRQAEALQKACKALHRVSEGIAIGVTGDLLAQDLRAAIYAIGEVTGEVTTDDLLHHIFANFCIGK